jgi:hypothetical protein
VTGDLDGGSELDAHRVQDLGSTLQRHAVVFVPLVAANHGGIHAQTLGKLGLCQAQIDAHGDEQLAEPFEIPKHVELAAFDPLIALDLARQLPVVRPQRFHRHPHLFVAQTLAPESLDLLLQTPTLLRDLFHRSAVFGFVLQHLPFSRPAVWHI